MTAVAVFHEHGIGFLSRVLKPGFRHVFVAIQSGECWIQIDGQAGVPEIESVAPAAFDIAGWYRGHGFTVVETYQRDEPPRSPFAIANCVGLAKAVLCVRSCAITPYGLYKHLRRQADGLVIQSGAGAGPRRTAVADPGVARCAGPGEAAAQDQAEPSCSDTRTAARVQQTDGQAA